MAEKLIKNELLGEEYYEIDHSSGLKIFVMEKKDYTGAFAMFGTRYGSVDTCFRLKGQEKFTTVPEGIAHFLEHKLFESEELDAFERFGKTGANANAFTSFDRTCYIFQCSSSFEENLEILLDFVKSPYFTEATVQKEQGIIGQEIRMYQDDPDWQVLFNLLRGIYSKNPVRIDIAGTTDSIAQINAELLYSCYNTFYNLSNMVLAVAGNVKKEEVLAIADKVLKKEDKVEFEQIIPEEPEKVACDYIEETLGVDIPKFALGFKENHREPVRTAKETLLMNLALDCIAGKVSPLYCRLLEEGLINSSFGKEYFSGRGFACPIFTGESREPKKAAEEIIGEIRRIKTEGISDEDFSVSLRRLYGGEIFSFNDVDDLAGNLVDAYFGGRGLFDNIELYQSVTKQEVEKTVAESFDTENFCLSVIK
ncbi:MAG: pitrilysin family protein [Oscillospiraceae bacterium]|nr:pitrilysin family protein [Oscillospiraceae bacterium]MDD6145931.1 pitrilysin family protein [Oscillospiraceae bacterium]